MSETPPTRTSEPIATWKPVNGAQQDQGRSTPVQHDRSKSAEKLSHPSRANAWGSASASPRIAPNPIRAAQSESSTAGTIANLAEGSGSTRLSSSNLEQSLEQMSLTTEERQKALHGLGLLQIRLNILKERYPDDRPFEIEYREGKLYVTCLECGGRQIRGDGGGSANVDRHASSAVHADNVERRLEQVQHEPTITSFVADRRELLRTTESRDIARRRREEPHPINSMPGPPTINIIRQRPNGVTSMYSEANQLTPTPVTAGPSENRRISHAENHLVDLENQLGQSSRKRPRSIDDSWKDQNAAEISDSTADDERPKSKRRGKESLEGLSDVNRFVMVERALEQQQALHEAMVAKLNEVHSFESRVKKLEKHAEIAVKKIGKVEDEVDELGKSSGGGNGQQHTDDFRIDDLVQSNKTLMLRIAALEEKNDRQVSKISELERKLRAPKRPSV